MAVLTCRGVERAYGDRVVLRGCDLNVEAGERVGLVGPNGCGKSTLLAILAGAEPPDAGTVQRPTQLGHLAQEPMLGEGTVGDAVDRALAWHRALIAAFERAHAVGDEAAAQDAQQRLDAAGWVQDHKVDALLTLLGAPDRSAPLARLSGGETRRVALALALLSSSELLLLDEPTNHLDAEAVDELQGWLTEYRGAAVLVTHDRYLLEALATRIVEVDDGVCVSYDGSYGDYLISRAERQAALFKAEDQRLSLIAREAEWASRSPAARTTKQQARLKRLDALMKTRPMAKEKPFSLDLRAGLDRGRTLVEATGLKKRYGDRVILPGLDLTLRPGDRLGIMGPNGAGKSTLLRVIDGTEQPDAGRINFGPRVIIATLDQHRTGLDPDDTVMEAAGGGNTSVRVGGEDVHVTSFLGRFLFGRQQLDQRVRTLSGGERARLLMARLLLKGASVLLLDEPTNDLDLMTLRVLEEALLSFDGAVVVVTHDRALLDRVCTSVLAFEETGGCGTYATRLQAQAAARARRAAAQAAAAQAAAQAAAAPRAEAPRAKKGLSWKEKQELAALPQRVEAIESELAELDARLGDPATYRDPKADVQALQRRHAALTQELESVWARWSELDNKG